MIRKPKVVALLAIVGVLAACSSVPYSKHVSDRQAAYAAAAGAPIQSFHFFQAFWSWESLGSDQVVVYTRPRTAYLLDVSGCPGLSFANTIGVTSNMNTVQAGLDNVVIGRDQGPCIITRIRPVDVAHMKAVQEKQRQIEAQPRPATHADG